MLELAPGALIKFSKASGGAYLKGALISFINLTPQNDTILISSKPKLYHKNIKKRYRKLFFVKLETIRNKFLRGT